MRLETIYREKWLKQFRVEGVDDESTAKESEIKNEMIRNEWAEALAGFSGEQIKKALDHCRDWLEWPPSFVEFRLLCLEAPREDMAFSAAAKRDLSHPVVKKAFDLIGSWAFDHDSERLLRTKWKTAYYEAVNCSNNEHSDSMGSEPHLRIPKPTPPLPHCSGYLNDTGEEFGAKKSIAKEWKREEYEKGSKKFKKEVFEERRRYLISMTDEMAVSLPLEEKYDRMRFLVEIDAMKLYPNLYSAAYMNPHEVKKSEIKKSQPWRKDIYD